MTLKASYALMLTGLLQAAAGMLFLNVGFNLPSLTSTAISRKEIQISKIPSDHSDLKKHSFIQLFQNIKAEVAKTDITELTFIENHGAIVIDLGKSAFIPTSDGIDLSPEARKLLKKVIPLLAQELKEAKLKKIKFLGLEKSGQSKEAYQRVKKIYRYIYNVQNLDFKNQDFLFSRTALSGKGNVFLDRIMDEERLALRLSQSQHLKENAVILKFSLGDTL